MENQLQKCGKLWIIRAIKKLPIKGGKGIVSYIRGMETLTTSQLAAKLHEAEDSENDSLFLAVMNEVEGRGNDYYRSEFMPPIIKSGKEGIL